MSAQGNLFPENTIAHLPMNGNALDITDNGYNGTVYGAQLTSDRFGNANSAYEFDGSNDYINLGSMGGFKSVSMWVRQDARNGFDFYFGHMDFRLYASLGENGRLTLGEENAHVTTPVHMDDEVGQWHHIVGISDGIDSKVYLDGADVTTSTLNLKSAENSEVNLGRWPGPYPSTSHYLNGAIDDVRVYENALTAMEVQTLYAIPEPTSAGLLALCSAFMWFFRRLHRK